MDITQGPYRELYDDLLDYNGKNEFDDLLLPWLENNKQEAQWLESFARRGGTPFSPAESSDLWRLYAFSRINDLILLKFQTNRYMNKYQGPRISLAQYDDFMLSLGLKKTYRREFHPFFHEVVKVYISPDPDQKIQLTGVIWPCYMLDNMMFSRAGVSVSGGCKHLLKWTAEISTIYWTSRRNNRSYDDLSRGWGSYSQWRTAFRRDYKGTDRYYYNVDVGADRRVFLNELPHDFTDRRFPGLSRNQRIELVRNRCFITHPDPPDDLWPYDDYYEEFF